MKLTPEDRLILSSIKINPSPAELEQINHLIPQIGDWEYLVNNIIDRGIGPLLFKKLPLLSSASIIPESVKIKLQQAYYKTFSRSMVLYEHFRKIIEAFSSKNIPVIALKGVYLSEWLYQDIGLRQFSDIDLLVNVKDGKKCLSILDGLGYRPAQSDVTAFVAAQKEIVHYAPMVMNGVSVEIHIKLHRDTEKYNLSIQEIWKNALPVTIHTTKLYTLNLNDLLIHLCVHLDKHFRGGNVQFTCFNDITNILDRYAAVIDWSVLTESCRFYNCEESVFKYIILINKYMNARLPDSIIQKYDYLLIEKDKILFCRYLQGYTANFSATPIHLGNLKQIESLPDKLVYLRDILFPPKVFMITKYKIKHSSLFFLYYPYRYFVGIKGLIPIIKKSFSNKSH